MTDKKPDEMKLPKYTKEQYSLLQKAYDHFNKRLFGGELPDVVITLQRKPKAAGYFSPERFTCRKTGVVIHEIALNPDTFLENRTPQQILSVLVHEQVHLWQQEFGEKKPRKAYHNREWANMMEEVGLIPSTTGQPGGARTGQSMAHYIIESGPFEWACEDFLMCHDAFLFFTILRLTLKKQAKKSKILYECQICGQKAWAKPGANLMCGQCQESMESEEQPDGEE